MLLGNSISLLYFSVVLAGVSFVSGLIIVYIRILKVLGFGNKCAAVTSS